MWLTITLTSASAGGATAGDRHSSHPSELVEGRRSVGPAAFPDQHPPRRDLDEGPLPEQREGDPLLEERPHDRLLLDPQRKDALPGGMGVVLTDHGIPENRHPV